MPKECIGVSAKCHVNAGERQEIVWEWVQSARGMEGEHISVGAKCHVNAGECRRMPGECKGVGAMSQ